MKRIILPFIILTLFLGGCFDMGQSDANENKSEKAKQDDKQKGKNAYEKENFVPVQDYTGEGYTLRGANSKTGKIAEAHRDDVDKAVKQFFKDSYKTKVKIHNIVSAKDGVSVFVESIGEPHFYTFAIVPVDVGNKEVKTDQVWSQEGQVENAIAGGLYVMANKEKFKKLDGYLTKIAKEKSIVGKTEEAVKNVGGLGYSNSYYFISTIGDVFDKLADNYMQNPSKTKENIKQFFKEHDYKSEDLIISIKMYMEKSDVDPDERIYNKLFEDISDKGGLPKGSYSLLLNDNYIDKRRGIGSKDNSIDHTKKEYILK